MSDGLPFAEYVYSETDEGSGGTFDVKEEMPYQGGGYAVALYGNKVPAEKWCPEQVDFFLNQGSQPILFRQSDGFYLGTWFPRDSDYVYLDVVRIVQDRTQAIKLAWEFKQKAIYDFANKRDIDVESAYQELLERC